MQKEEEFETAFSEFIDQNQYDTAQEALFRIVRQAFIAGWQAAKNPLAMPKASQTSQALDGVTQ